MIKREELSNPVSCMSRAADDEMTFVLLGRDAAAPYAIRAWVEQRVRLGKNVHTDPQIVEALACADRMQLNRLPEREVLLVSISEMNRRIAEAEETRDLLWIKHAEAIRLEGIQMFENPMLALAARVALERRRGAKC